MQCASLDLPFAISEPGGNIKGLFLDSFCDLSAQSLDILHKICLK